MASRSPSLNGYSELIAEIKKNSKSMSREEAIKAAIKTCISRGNLLSFLEKHCSEIENMLLTDWNTEEALEVRYEEGVEKGVAIGEAKGIAIGEAKGVAIGEARGVDKERSYIRELLKQGLSHEEILERLDNR